jgi:hypothetical protein
MSRRPNLAPHQYAQYFHLEGDVEIAPTSPENGTALRIFDGDGDAACLIVPGAETESRWRTVRDDYLDDVYGVPNTKGSPWVAELTRRIRGRAVFTHFILTGEAAGMTAARCRYLGSHAAPWLDWQHDGISANALDLDDLGTLLVASAPYDTPLESSDLATDAELAIGHLDRRGKPRAWMMVRGSHLAVGGKTLRRSRGRKREQIVQS